MRRTARAAAAALVLGLGLALSAAGAAAADDGGIGITIDIPSTDGTSTGGTGSADTSGGSGYPDTTVPTDAPPSDVAAPGATPAPVAAVDNGPFNVSGLNAKFVPSLNPGAGKIMVSFSVHNGSASTWPSSVRLWLTGPFGNTLDDTGALPVKTLKPGETIHFTRTLTGVGQWTVVNAHASFTPPATIDGIATKPAVRGTTVFAFPWLGSVGAVLGATALAIVLALRAAASAPAVVMAVRG
jgi:hypothetical protein